LLSLICVSAAALDFTPTTFADGVGNGSLRDATIAANLLNGTDKIILAEGEYELTVPFDNLSVTPATNGDLDITRIGGVLTIQGAVSAKRPFAASSCNASSSLRTQLLKLSCAT